MKHACARSSPFWPSPCEFIQRCRKGEYSGAGLQDKDELYDNRTDRTARVQNNALGKMYRPVRRYI
ncbi:replication protein P [Pantoea dispersa]|uniref:replication protein P n=1 Tax=Pantoea dispersa TaxID=59814 RepID=UPI0021AEA741|nr:replication protein P [Pantoea dispersa]MCT6592646.1 replication protein P [Pantoea dispersa]